ncbi:hypothetical protein Q3G72_023607 [Acer saccharum]|nr:hypothetical protein Q3G72_023607 [Acer saccharum]
METKITDYLITGLPLDNKASWHACIIPAREMEIPVRTFLDWNGVEGDTVFVMDNLVRVSSKYDHNQFYYIGSTSKIHMQNMDFSYGMAYGGRGFAISYPLEKAKMQDECLHRYPNLYGSDQRIYACLAELRVPLTREPGFHQVHYLFGC